MTCLGFLILFHCSQPSPPPVVDVARFCKLARPIAWSRTDSEATRLQIRAHNAKGKAVCGWGSKVKP